MRDTRTSNDEERRGCSRSKFVRNHQDVRSKKPKVGRPTYINPDEEASAVASADIGGAHGIPTDVNTLGAELQLIIKVVNARQSTKYITANSSYKYTRSVIKRVDCKEDGRYMQRKNTRIGLAKVSRISNNIVSQSDPRLA